VLVGHSVKIEVEVQVVKQEGDERSLAAAATGETGSA
jgi:hypothetical protein